jgi:hypothetical protein
MTESIRLTTNDRDVRELWAEYLTWITAEARRRFSDMTFGADGTFPRIACQPCRDLW